MKKLFIFVLTLFVFSVQAQKNGTVLFSLGNEPVYLGEFKYIYEKNNRNDSNFYKPANVREYLDLFIKFKLKVKEAKSIGTDTTAAFRKEFKTYRDQLVRPYLTDKSSIDKLVKEAYERMKTEVKASHIMVVVAEDATPVDSLKAYNKILEVYKKLQAGEDFEKLALANSEDPSVKYNKGNLGYFNTFNLIYSFETKAYNTPVGQYSNIFRTQFGYHILKVTDRRPYQGQIKIAQILIKKPATATENDDISRLKADSVFRKLQNGANFSDMVKAYSDDERSKSRNGEIPAFNAFTFQVPEAIRENAFNLKKDGDISAPFKTDLGWIILRRMELKGLDSFKILEPNIRTRVNNDSRSLVADESMIAKIKKDNNFKANKKGLDVFNTAIDSTILIGKWKISDPKKFSKELFRIGKIKYSQLDFAKYIESNQGNFKFNNKQFALKSLYNEYLRTSLYAYADSHLEDQYPEFKNLVNEYKEGMMLFDITDKMVWTKAMNDTIGQEKFYSESKSKYMWKKRVDAEIYTCKTPEIAAKVVKYLESGKLTADSIANLLNKIDPLNISYSKGTYEEGENQLINNYFGQTGIILAGNQLNQVLNLKKYTEPEPKKLSEIRGLIISEYQNTLEKKWVEELKVKYPVVIDEAAVETMIKNK